MPHNHRQVSRCEPFVRRFRHFVWFCVFLYCSYTSFRRDVFRQIFFCCHFLHHVFHESNSNVWGSVGMLCIALVSRKLRQRNVFLPFKFGVETFQFAWNMCRVWTCKCRWRYLLFKSHVMVRPNVNLSFVTRADVGASKSCPQTTAFCTRAKSSLTSARSSPKWTWQAMPMRQSKRSWSRSKRIHADMFRSLTRYKSVVFRVFFLLTRSDI